MSMITLPSSASPKSATTARRTAVWHREDNDVACRRGSVCPCGCSRCELLGEASLGGVAADDLDGVSGLGDTAAIPWPCLLSR